MIFKLTKSSKMGHSKEICSCPRFADSRWEQTVPPLSGNALLMKYSSSEKKMYLTYFHLLVVLLHCICPPMLGQKFIVAVDWMWIYYTYVSQFSSQIHMYKYVYIVYNHHVDSINTITPTNVYYKTEYIYSSTDISNVFFPGR